MRNSIMHDLRTKKTKTNGKVEVQFIHKGKACQVIEVNTKLGKLCADFQLITKDLEIVESTIKTALIYRQRLEASALQNEPFNRDHPDHIVFGSLLISSIITYWKCFADSTRRKGKIPEQKLKSTIGNELYKTHLMIQEKRNSFVAHAGENQHESAKSIILLDPHAVAPHALIFHSTFEYFAISEHLEDFLELVEKVSELTKTTQREKCSILTKELDETFTDLLKTAKDHIIFLD
ncbi:MULTISPECIES: hypothetical protein [unclassified Pseudomonas]|uniref:hypothetical protein n=1 Tax=unclassified Pseudomonas TaxID=196821 RepID=UPI002892DF96|nr:MULTISPECIES: hypothetical protein [unclassified Pseudomonas]